MIRVALLLTPGTPEVGWVIQQGGRMFTFQARPKVNNCYVKMVTITSILPATPAASLYAPQYAASLRPRTTKQASSSSTDQGRREDGLNRVPLPDLPPPPARGRTRTSGRNYLGARLRNWWLFTARSGNEVCATIARQAARPAVNRMCPGFAGQSELTGVCCLGGLTADVL